MGLFKKIKNTADKVTKPIQSIPAPSPPPPPKVEHIKNKVKREKKNIKEKAKETQDDSFEIIETVGEETNEKVIQPIETGFKTTIIDGFKEDVIDGFKEDIIKPIENTFESSDDNNNKKKDDKNNTQNSSVLSYVLIGTAVLATVMIL
jgi:hypothetical protein